MGRWRATFEKRQDDEPTDKVRGIWSLGKRTVSKLIINSCMSAAGHRSQVHVEATNPVSLGRNCDPLFQVCVCMYWYVGGFAHTPAIWPKSRLPTIFLNRKPEQILDETTQYVNCLCGISLGLYPYQHEQT